MERSNVPWGWIKEKLEEAYIAGYPIRPQELSNNLGTGDITDTEPPTKQHTQVGMRHMTLIQNRTSWPDLSEKRCTQPLGDLRSQRVGDLVGLGRGCGNIFLEMSKEECYGEVGTSGHRGRYCWDCKGRLNGSYHHYHHHHHHHHHHYHHHHYFTKANVGKIYE